jgi:hypothetical protein
MLQEVEGTFAILAEVLSFLHMLGAAGHPLKPTLIQRDESIFRARTGIIAVPYGCIAFVLVASVFNTHVAHGTAQPP